MDRIKQMLDTIDTLTDDQIVELQNAIVTEFDTVEGEDPTSETVETMTTLADMLDTVRGEAKRREAQTQELTARAAEAASRVHAAVEEDMPETPEGEGEEQEPAAEEVPGVETPASEDEEKKTAPAAPAMASTETVEASELSTEEVASTETPAAAEAAVEVPVAAELAETSEVAELAGLTNTEVAHEEQKDQEAPMTAAAEDGTLEVEVQAPADRRPIQKATAPVVITAGADIPGYTAGSQMSSATEIAEAMAARLHGLRRVKGGDGEQHIVASLTTKYPDARILNQDTDTNVSKIKAVASPEALVASGGHSTPFEVRYDIFGFGMNERPIRDSLPRFQADRGGIRYIVPPVLVDYDSAIGVWTNVVDTSPGTTVKNSLTIAAATETTVATDAVTLQLKFGNLMTRAYPELIARHNELALIQHAREAEQYLVSKLDAGSIAVTSTSLIGVARDFLVQIGRAAAAYRSRHRLDPHMQLTVVAPAWVKGAIRADLALAMPGDNSIAATDAEIENYLSVRGVTVVWSPDMTVFGTQSAGAMLEFPDSFDWYIFAEGTFLFLDGGTLDLGIVRDSTLLGTNDYRMFVETFEGIAKVGVESMKVTSTVSVNGVAAALRDTTGGATAAAIEY